MTVREALNGAVARLSEAGVMEARLDAQVLLSHALCRDRLVMLSLHMEDQLEDAVLSAFQAMTARRAQREPLQYILGQAWFMGRRLMTAPGVLIPRQDTEILCQRALCRIKPGDSALDLCCGSGCLAIALKLACREADLTAVDISEDAIALTRRNADSLGADIRILQGDLFAPVGERRFEMVLSNPPYIPRQELKRLQEEVRKEPALALDGGEDGLRFYRLIIRQAPRHLKPGGVLLLELGQGQAEQVADLLPPGFSAPILTKDLSGIPRVLETQWTGGVQ